MVKLSAARLACLSIFAISTPVSAEGVGAATLTVKVERVSPNGGNIRIALYDSANWAGTDGEPTAGAMVPAMPGETVVTLSDIEPGIYAIKTFQDENKNEKMDFSWLGIPLERFGFSNNARPLLDQPSFDAAKFEIRPGANETTITLRSLF